MMMNVFSNLESLPFRSFPDSGEPAGPAHIPLRCRDHPRWDGAALVQPCSWSPWDHPRPPGTSVWHPYGVVIG